MTKREIINRVYELESNINTDIEHYIKVFNESMKKRNSSYRMDNSSYYPFMVGYIGQGLKDLINDIEEV